MTLTRRRFLQVAAMGCVAGAGLRGWHTGRRLPGVDEYPLSLHGLPSTFEGFRLLLITDVHAGANMDFARMVEVVGRADSLRADLIVLGGDMIDGRATGDDVRAFTSAFGNLTAPYGVVAVPGNHEHFAGIEVATEAFREAGFGLLVGDHRIVESARGSLALIGVDDPQLPDFDPPQVEAVTAAIRSVPDGPLPILVAHRPAAFDTAASLGVPLTLSGHTHGGQIGTPLRDLTPVRLATRYVRGHYRRGDAHLIVSSGVGSGGMPIRVGVPPSVALITLCSAGP